MKSYFCPEILKNINLTVSSTELTLYFVFSERFLRQVKFRHQRVTFHMCIPTPDVHMVFIILEVSTQDPLENFCGFKIMFNVSTTPGLFNVRRIKVILYHAQAEKYARKAEIYAKNLPAGQQSGFDTEFSKCGFCGYDYKCFSGTKL